MMKQFDLRDTIIPLSLLQATNHFHKMESGESMEIICNDSGPASDIQTILPAGRFEVVSVEDNYQNENGYRTVIRKL
ncbi:TusA-related sulfurtransferase [Desulfatibacillum alkenivorans DSM 16219]|uniref:TusA-related sulfurtransferase n=1 Tax=Desulfatibacillum alkenivorans DSM 16219 TaxID=1121393 RepID=A0A1M6MUQ9_9BACT|nr:sulfurtransferase TusA family protein [Desulfatibacillum alkenivorans]SHJ87187.1 TusA-related sulfurtransferase [Desulfatibacillum alkenivorans DSM 16219]